MRNGQETAAKKARELGIKDEVLAESVYTDTENPVPDQPTIAPWNHTLHLITKWCGDFLRHDLAYITLSGALERDDHGCLRFHEPCEFSLVEKSDDENDVADPLIGDKVRARIPRLEETILHGSTMREYMVPCDEFPETYPDFWKGLHPNIRDEIEANTIDVFVNPTSCRLFRNRSGRVPGISPNRSYHVPFYKFKRVFWDMTPSSEVEERFANRYARWEGRHTEVGLTGYRNGQGMPIPTGCFILLAAPRKGGQRSVLVFLGGQLVQGSHPSADSDDSVQPGMEVARLITITYNTFMAHTLMDMAHLYGLYLPQEPSSERSKRCRRRLNESYYALHLTRIRADENAEDESCSAPATRQVPEAEAEDDGPSDENDPQEDQTLACHNDPADSRIPDLDVPCLAGLSTLK